MKTVVSTDAYTITVDGTKNRVYITMRGSWTNPQQIVGWLEGLAAAFKLCKPGFTEFIDWTESNAILLTDEIAKAQKLAMDGGLRKAARLYKEETFLKLQMDRLTEKTNFPVKSFYDKKEAEAWLDEP
jgi:hypothetical protein